METYSAATLEGAEIKRPPMVVDGLLPAGLCVLAGSPKIGKSWLSLALGCAVADGTLFLGRQAYEGDVLYLDLEGSPTRLQDRLEQLGMGYPERLKVAHAAPTLDAGLLDEIDYWQSCAPLPRLIIIDTVGRVKGRADGRKTAYDADTEIYGRLQSYALERGLCIVAVTHLRKLDPRVGNDGDWLERITGSMGLSGAADCVWGLFRQRGNADAFLRTSARDVDVGDMVIRFDSGRWEFVSNDLDSYSFKTDPIVQFIDGLDFFNGSMTELCDKYVQYAVDHGFHTGLPDGDPAAAFGKRIRKISGELWRVRKSLTVKRSRNGSTVSLSKF